MPTSAEAEVVEYVDDLLVHLPLKEKLLIRSLLVLLEVQPLVLNGRSPKLFSRASLDERYRNLRGWEKSNIFQRRLVFMAIRTLLLWAYVDSQEAERDMGLIGGTFATERRNRIRAAAERVVSEVNRSAPPEALDAEYEAAARELPSRPWGSAPHAAESLDSAEKHV